MERFKDFLTIKEAAEFVGVTAETLRNWDRRGKLVPARHPVNGYRLYRRKDLESLLKPLRQTERLK
ncbi:MAG: MerR family DNA-binding transcriptional regulator [Thermodesulfobacteriota bacterium]|nr:MerR family DNA-binding transcriptional regulator [Thermodesulfobacteriota bacterium]